MTIHARKRVDRAGNVTWHLSKGDQCHVLQFTASQYRHERDLIVRAFVRTRNQLKGVKTVQRLSEADVLKEFGR